MRLPPAFLSFARLGRRPLLVLCQQLLKADCRPARGAAQLRLDRAVRVVHHAADQAEAIHLCVGRAGQPCGEKLAMGRGGQQGYVKLATGREGLLKLCGACQAIEPPKVRAAGSTAQHSTQHGTCRPSCVRPGLGRKATPASSANCSTSCTQGWSGREGKSLFEHACNLELQEI